MNFAIKLKLAFLDFFFYQESAINICYAVETEFFLIRKSMNWSVIKTPLLAEVLNFIIFYYFCPSYQRIRSIRSENSLILLFVFKKKVNWQIIDWYQYFIANG